MSIFWGLPSEQQSLLAHLQPLFSVLGSELEAGKKKKMTVTMQDKRTTKSNSLESAEDTVYIHDSTRCALLLKEFCSSRQSAG